MSDSPEQQSTLQPKYNLKDMYKNNDLRNFSMASSAYIKCGKVSLKKGKKTLSYKKSTFANFQNLRDETAMLVYKTMAKCRSSFA